MMALLYSNYANKRSSRKETAYKKTGYEKATLDERPLAAQEYQDGMSHVYVWSFCIGVGVGREMSETLTKHGGVSSDI